MIGKLVEVEYTLVRDSESFGKAKLGQVHIPLPAFSPPSATRIHRKFGRTLKKVSLMVQNWHRGIESWVISSDHKGMKIKSEKYMENWTSGNSNTHNLNFYLNTSEK